MITTTVIIKKIFEKQRRGKVRSRKRLKILHYTISGEAPYVKEMEKKGR